MYMKDILEKFVTIAKVIENVDVESYSRSAKRFSIAAIVTGSSND